MMIERLLILNHSSVMSGGEIALVGLLSEGLGHQQRVVVDMDGPLVGVLRQMARTSVGMVFDDNFHPHVRPHRRSSPLEMVRSLLAMRARYALEIREFAPDVIYVNTLRSALVMIFVRSAAPVVYHCRDRLSADYLPGYLIVIIRATFAWSFEHAVCNSRATAALVPLPAARKSVIPSPVSSAFASVPPPKAVAGEPVRIAIIGRLTSWKGQHLFLEALGQLRTEHPWSAVIAGGPLFGETEYAAGLAESIGRMGLSAEVQMLGHVDDVAALMERVDIVVHASIIPEPFGQVVVQGMCAGRLVVASGEGGPAEIIDDGVNGLLFSPRSAEALASALEAGIASPALRARLGSAARNEYGTYSAENVTGRLRSLLAELSVGVAQ